MKNLSRIVRCGALACSVLLGVALALAAFWGAPGFAQNRRGRVRWDIASNSSFSPGFYEFASRLFVCLPTLHGAGRYRQKRCLLLTSGSSNIAFASSAVISPTSSQAVESTLAAASTK